MTISRHPAFARPIVAGPYAGAVAGAVFLGLGGRLAMFAFAAATRPSHAFTLGGSLNVVAAGAIAGALGGVLLGVASRFLPVRRWLRGLCFAGACYLIASPGFRPPTPLVFALFAPVFLGYGLTCIWAFDRLVATPPSNLESKPTAAASSLVE